jgi:hypothetical protein
MSPKADDGIYGVTALQYNQFDLQLDRSDLVITTPTFQTSAKFQDPISSISGYGYIYGEGNSAFVGFQLDWIPPAGAINNYVVQYRMDNDNWQRLNTTAPSVASQLACAKARSTYKSKLKCTRQRAQYRPPLFNSVGKTKSPANVQNLQLEVLSDNTARLSWESSFEIDVINGGAVYVRHSALTDGSASWNDSVDLVPALPGNATTATIPLVEGEIFVRFVDDADTNQPQ